MYKLSSQLVLASGSPRRKELLQEIGIGFVTASSDVDETILTNESPRDLVLRLSEAKAMAVTKNFPDRFILGADTDVALGERILGKPSSPEDSISMLQSLSGSTHQVFGGIALYDPKHKKVLKGVSTTSVTFRKLSTEEIMAYSRTNEPYDKAGGYAAQGIGASFIEKIEGSFSNVVGLDLSVALDLFKKAGILLV